MKVPILFSYAYIRRCTPEHIDYVLNDDRLELLMDSGAFTAFNSGDEIKLDDYMQFVAEHGRRLVGFMALDKLQDPVTTESNLRTMHGAGLRPIPIHVFGDTAERMDELFGFSEWVALGGFRRPHRGAAPPSYVKEKMRWAAGRHVHWLGYTDLSMIKAFRPYSVDCASFGSGRMYGQMHVYVGGGKMIVLTRTEWDAKKTVGGYDHRRLRAAVAAVGFDPADYDRGESWSYVNKVHRVHLQNAASWVWYALDVRRLIGTRVFLAIEPQDWRDIEAVRAGIDLAAARGLLTHDGATP